ncbi:MAG: hypothetical protein AB7J28_09205 [Hyphomonadaceae bacterium]
MVWWWWIIPAFVALIGVALLIGGFGWFFRGRAFKGGRGVVSGGLITAAAAAVGLLGLNIQTYHRLTYERPVAEISLRQLGPQHFTATLTEPDGQARDFEVRGDEWRVEARVLRWRPWANVLGLDSQYRLERLSGRYADTDQERHDERSVYGIGAVSEPASNAVDLWAVSQQASQYVPVVDTLYGSGAYMPMANGATYEVIITQSGLIARPTNEAAQAAITHWD